MAEDGQVLVWIKFLVGARGDVAHGHEGAGFDVGGGVFPGLADVDEAGLVFAEESGCVGWGDFVFEHVSSLVGRASRLKPPEESSLEEMPPILNAQSITKQFGA